MLARDRVKKAIRLARERLDPKETPEAAAKRYADEHAQWLATRGAGRQSITPLSELASTYHELGPEHGEMMRQKYLDYQAREDAYNRWASRKHKPISLPEYRPDEAALEQLAGFDPQLAERERVRQEQAAQQQALANKAISKKEKEIAYRRQLEAQSTPLQLEPFPGMARSGTEIPSIHVPARLLPTAAPLTHITSQDWSGGNWPTNLWIAPNAKETLKDLIASHPQELIDRLRFAIPNDNSDRLIIHSPTELQEVIDGRRVTPTLSLPPGTQGFHQSARSGIHIPDDYKVFPPPNRSNVRQALGDKPDSITWLSPQEKRFRPQIGELSGPGYKPEELPRGFGPESMPISAFRPAEDFISYKVPSKPRELTPIEQGPNPFGLHPFYEESEGPPARVATPPAAATRPTPVRVPPAAPTPAPRSRGGRSRVRRAAQVVPTPVAPAAEFQPSQLEAQRQELEKQFRELDTPMDDPARQGIWRQLGDLSSQMNDRQEAAIDYANALWMTPANNPEAIRQDSWRWLQSEDPSANPTPTSAEFASDIAKAQPEPADLRRLAARLIQAGTQPIARDVQQIMPQVNEYLANHEHLLGVRPAWMAWQAMGKSDTLAQTRARDRLLRRLTDQKGENLALDTARFLRTGSGSGSHHAIIRQHMPEITAAINSWHQRMHSIERPTRPPEGVPSWDAHNRPFTDLLTAFTQAKIGNQDMARSILGQVAPRLAAERNPVRRWLMEAYTHRVNQALAGQPTWTPLPPNLIQSMPTSAPGGNDNMARYYVERYLQNSDLLMPLRGTEASARQSARGFLRDAFTLADQGPQAFAQGFPALANQAWRGVNSATAATTREAGAQLSHLYHLALTQAVHVNEPFAMSVAERVPEIVGLDAGSLYYTAGLAAAGMGVATHYAHTELASRIAQAFAQRLASYPTDGQNATFRLRGLSSFVSAGLPILIRNGQRDMAYSIVQRMADAVTPNGQPTRNDHMGAEEAAHIAQAWEWVGRPDYANPLLDRVRNYIQASLTGTAQAGNNAANYARNSNTIGVINAYLKAASVAPSHEAAQRLKEFFANVPPYLNREDIPSAILSANHAADLEAAARGLSGDTGSTNDNRRMADDSEFLTRRRIRDDIQALLKQQGLV